MTTSDDNTWVLQGTSIVDPDLGVVRPNQGIVVDDGVISWVGPYEQVQPHALETHRRVDARGTFTLPGLIDCHTHITFDAAPQGMESDAVSPDELDARARLNLDAQLRAGVTTVRDCGSWDRYAIDFAANHPDGIWPRVLAAGKVITIPEGHGYFIGNLVQGDADAVRAVNQELDHGAAFIKLIATGGVMTKGVSTDDIGLSERAMSIAVEQAHARGARVTAHATGLAGARSAVRAGVDSLEHGMRLDESLLEEMAIRGTVLVPTLSALHGLLNHSHDLPGWAVDKAERVDAAAHDSLARAVRAGVRIAAGTDSGTPLNPHGSLPGEIGLMVDAGLSIPQALSAATSVAADNVGLGHQVGSIAPGFSADLLVLTTDPLMSVSALSGIAIVFRDGRRAPSVSGSYERLPRSGSADLSGAASTGR